MFACFGSIPSSFDGKTIYTVYFSDPVRLNKIEAGIDAALAEVKAENDEVMDNITVI